MESRKRVRRQFDDARQKKKSKASHNSTANILEKFDELFKEMHPSATDLAIFDGFDDHLPCIKLEGEDKDLGEVSQSDLDLVQQYQQTLQQTLFPVANRDLLATAAGLTLADSYLNLSEDKMDECSDEEIKSGPNSDDSEDDLNRSGPTY